MGQLPIWACVRDAKGTVMAGAIEILATREKTIASRSEEADLEFINE